MDLRSLQVLTTLSIQDTQTGGFDFKFTENKFCKAVLSLYFDDIVMGKEDATLFLKSDVNNVIDFALKHKAVDTLLVHCCGGNPVQGPFRPLQSRCLAKIKGTCFMTGVPKENVYNTLLRAGKKDRTVE